MKLAKAKGLPLIINQWLSFDWWEVNEAAFILTAWPENMIAIGVAETIRIQFDRGVIYAPGERLLKKTLNQNTSEVLLQMRKSIENGELNAHSRNLFLGKSYGKNVSYLVRSHDLILWFLLRGFILPNQLQHALGTHQLKNIQFSEDLHKTVKNVIAVQYLLIQNPALIKNDLINKKKPYLDWIKRFGTANESNDKEFKAVLRDLDELFPKNKKLGRPLKNQAKFNIPQVISNVMQKSAEGIIHYYFPLLKTCMETATKIKIEIIGREQLFKMTEQEFIDELFKDEIVGLYLEGASVNVLNMVKIFCMKELSFFYSHYKINYIPKEYRKKMSVGQLWEMNKEFCWERFTKEERNLFEKLDEAKKIGVEVVLTQEEKKLFEPRLVDTKISY